MHRTLPATPTLATLAAATLALAACGESADTSKAPSSPEDTKTELVVAGVPSEESSNIEAQFDVLGKLIKKELDLDTEFQSATDYAAVIEGLNAGKIDIAMMGPFSYVIAGKKGVELTPLGAVASAADAEPGYYSIGWAPKDSEITKIEDFTGKTICFVDVASTSGYLYPTYGLKSVNIDPEKDLEQVLAGGHDASLLSIKSGQCDAGFAYEEMQDQLVKSGQLAEGDVKEVWRSPKIMGSPIAVNNSTIDADTVNKLTDLFATKANKPWLVENGVCPSESECDLPEDSEYGFKAVKDSDYDGVRDVCDVTKAEACKE